MTPISAAQPVLASDEQTFAALLFGASDREDLDRYDPASLAKVAAAAEAWLAEPRAAGQSKVRLSDTEVLHDGRRRTVTIVEAINDDMPFLLDSTLTELVDRGLEPLLVAHPIFNISLDADGTASSPLALATNGRPAGTRRVSFIQIHLDMIFDEGERSALLDGLARVYSDVGLAVGDFRAMRARVKEAIRDFKGARARRLPLPDDEIEEAQKFLRWLIDDNFTLLGVRTYRFPADVAIAEPVEGSSLGILRDAGINVLKRGRDLVAITPEIRAFLVRPVALVITKANVKSRVHRRVHLDYIGVKLFADEGTLEGELRILGLFTSNIYTSAASSLPYLGLKIQRVIALAGFDPQSYSGRGLLHILDTYPRDELFQMDAEMLHRFALELLRLSEHPRVRALVRTDEFGRFISAMVFVPKDRYDTQIRQRIGQYLCEVFRGRLSSVYPAYPDGPLARTQFIIGLDAESRTDVDVEAIEDAIRAIVATWTDKLVAAIAATAGPQQARAVVKRFGGTAFSAAYREAFDATAALHDIAIIERLSDQVPRAVDLYRRAGDPAERANLKVFAWAEPIPLSERVPLLENLGFRVINERTYRVVPADGGGRLWLHDVTLERAQGGALDLHATEQLVEPALMALFAGEAESDRFNGLIIAAGLPWRDAALLRAFGRYLQQLRIAYSQDYIADALVRNAPIARAIVEMFHVKFDPAGPDAAMREAAVSEKRTAILASLDGVASLDDDQILRHCLNITDTALRTNLYQRDPEGHPRATIAIKVESRRVEGMPLPKPLYEIFVYSPRVEGIHLRFGKVARGGLRWSDRPQDFRTEVLGLVKAQQVKNAVIVPVGAKGGFYPKHLPPASDRQAWMAEGVASYRTFVSTLLDLTDNIIGNEVVSPAATVRYDADDPYLVVAADKGTATFSDIANDISLAHNHWLGDAFASGGSHGYDHKKMGITARGAWEAVKRHFREIDIDIQRQSVTTVGVGDMSGDVFGNGMLLSDKLKLVAAFDHRDIFIDPAPEPERAHAERQRLFALPRSSWQDYDASLISPGGGVFPRSAKSIRLSDEARAVLGIEAEEMAPAELIAAILKAPVDLLFFGGIGTYVRGSEERNEEVGDRTNDALRVAGADLRCRVVGEGANLGVTQRGRIEAAQRGIRLNTDAIDNSAGVNTSDIEVNIKIALAGPQRQGEIGEADRDALLAAMTDEVAALVLRNNYLQTLAISLCERRGSGEIGFARRFMIDLEHEGRLDRAVEFLPDDAALTAREQRGEPLTRPEIAVLLAYAKLALHDALLDSNVPDDPYLAHELQRYFPPELRQRFPGAISGHRLRRDIVATQLANAVVNRGGPTIVARITDQTGADAAQITRAYAATRESFGLTELNGLVDALDGQVPGQLQLDLYADLQSLLFGHMVWFIRNVDLAGLGLDEVIGIYRGGIDTVAARLDEIIPAATSAEIQRRIEQLEGQGVPAATAARFARLRPLVDAPAIVATARRLDRSIADVGATHYAVADAFGLDGLAQAGRAIATSDFFDRLALDRALDSIATAHGRLTTDVLASAWSGADGVAAWIDRRSAEVDRIRTMVGNIVASGLTLSKLTVAASLLGDLARG